MGTPTYTTYTIYTKCVCKGVEGTHSIRIHTIEPAAAGVSE